jgi:hypothetical protein
MPRAVSSIFVVCLCPSLLYRGHYQLLHPHNPRATPNRVLAAAQDCLRDKRGIGEKGSCWVYRVRLNPRAPPLAVTSAFNGGAIYNLRAIAPTGCAYNGSAVDGGMVCEHVPFHECLAQR